LPAEFRPIADICTATDGTIGGVPQLVVADHRSLHAGLDVGRDHTTWIKARIAEFSFVEGRDYEMTEDLSSPISGSSKARPQKVHVYRLTLTMAKELAMVEGNEKGKLARRYFIWAEGCANPIAGLRPTQRVVSPTRIFREHFGIAKLIGLGRTPAALAANSAAMKLTGTDVLGAMGVSDLIASQQVAWCRPSQEHAAWLEAACKAAAEGRAAFSKAGANGLYERRAQLPLILRDLGREELRHLAERMLADGRIVAGRLANQKGGHPGHLDVPGGPVARGQGYNDAGAWKHDWDRYEFDATLNGVFMS
jgi:phage anti-repressor protein